MLSKGPTNIKKNIKWRERKKGRKTKKNRWGPFKFEAPDHYPKSNQHNEEAAELLLQHHLSACHSKGRCMPNPNALLWRKPNNPLGMSRPPQRKQGPAKCIIRLRKKKKKKHAPRWHASSPGPILSLRDSFSSFKSRGDAVWQEFYLYNDPFSSSHALEPLPCLNRVVSAQLGHLS